MAHDDDDSIDGLGLTIRDMAAASGPQIATFRLMLRLTRRMESLEATVAKVETHYMGPDVREAIRDALDKGKNASDANQQRLRALIEALDGTD